MWLWILAGVLLVVTWGGGFILTAQGWLEGISLQLWITLGIVLFVAGVLVYRWWRARAAARALERELIKQTEQQAARARPDRRAEILQLQRQMLDGIQALKRSRLGKRHGESALYALPWYAIIGPPGAGKTTALRHSGLNFAFLDSRGAGVRGVGGTRNCDWWFTNEAILLDTAGRYTTHDDDRDEWFAFLDLLKRYRKQSPLNGLILAVPLPQVAEASGQEAAEMAKTLRARVDEIMTRLDIVLPVYLMFTKCDLVAGFIECWGDLRKSERDQIFGATFPVGPAQDPAAQFSAEFDTLVSRVASRAVQEVSQARMGETRLGIFQYPLELRTLGAPLADFVGQLFQQNPFQENPVFRGFYLTSGTQEGTPVDHLLGGMARAFGLKLPLQSAPAEPKSYFVTDLFRRVMFPDQHLVARTYVARQRELVTGVTTLSVGLIVSALLLWVSSCSFSGNRKLLNDGRRVAREARSLTWGDAQPLPPKVERLNPLQAQVRQLDEWKSEGPPLRLRWGLYAGNALYPPLLGSYLRQLEEAAVRPTRERVRAGLARLGNTATLPPNEYGHNYNRLKLYLLMNQPELLEVHYEWATDQFMSEWNQARKSTADADLMKPHVAYYLDLMRRKEIPPWRIEDPLVSRARSVLVQAPPIERMYQALVAEASSQIAPIRRETIFFGDIAEFVTSKKNLQVDGAYTKEGWNRVKKLLTHRQSTMESERWVLGEAAQAEADAEVSNTVERLRGLYFERSLQAWKAFLEDMQVHEPEDATTALEELSALSEPEWPYQRLLRTVHDNVSLDVEPPPEDGVLPDGLLNRIAKRAERKVNQAAKTKTGVEVTDGNQLQPAAEEKPPRKVSPVEKKLEPLIDFGVAPGDDPKGPPPKLNEYQDVVAQLVAVLTDLRDSGGSTDQAAIAGEFEKAYRKTFQLLSTQTGYTRPLLSPYLVRPIRAAWAGVVQSTGGAVQGVWETAVWEEYHLKLEGKYPFKDVPEDVALEDYTEFFRPGTGLLWGFYDEHLKHSLQRSGKTFTPTQRFQSSVAYAPGFLDNCLSRGAGITDATFASKAEEPAVQFDVNLHSVSDDVAEVTLEIDGVQHTYKNTPEEWLATTWPAPKAEARGAKIRIRGFNALDEVIVREGPFGFFRMLDAADDVSPGTAGGRQNGVPTIVATWRLRSQESFVKLDLRPSRTDAALSSKVFRNYECPRRIMSSR